VKGAKHGVSEDRECIRSYGTERGLSSQLREELAKEHVKDLANKQKAKKEARAVDKVCRFPIDSIP
jgi:amino-acid N-acetyltransferase